MTDPVRLLDQNGDDLGKRLLRSAEPDGPSNRSWQRALGAVAAATAATSATSAVSAGSGAAVVILKWLGIGALAGSVVAVSADRMTRPDHRDASEQAATTDDHQSHRSPQPTLDPRTANYPAPPTTDPDPKTPTTQRHPAAAPTAADDSLQPPLGPSVAAFEKPPGSADTLADELRRLDRARTKLAGGHHGLRTRLPARPPPTRSRATTRRSPRRQRTLQRSGRTSLRLPHPPPRKRPRPPSPHHPRALPLIARTEPSRSSRGVADLAQRGAVTCGAAVGTALVDRRVLDALRKLDQHAAGQLVADRQRVDVTIGEFRRRDPEATAQ
jgi:hypothetical protein